MDAINNFLAVVGGFLARTGILLAIPLVLAALVGAGMLIARLVRGKAGVIERVGGLFFKADRYYSPAHGWLAEQREAGWKVGLDDLAQRMLPLVWAVELPKPGTHVNAGETAAVITCGNKKVAVPALVDGTVSAANDNLAHQPELIRDVYGNGWLYAIKPDKEEFGGLFKNGTARVWFQGEAARLTQFAERELGVAAADGGEIMITSTAGLPDGKWQLMLKEFLHAHLVH